MNAIEFRPMPDADIERDRQAHEADAWLRQIVRDAEARESESGGIIC